jgi:genome maintenance exonuclease 1
MTHLHAWRKRIGEQKAQQITTESANIGTVMHRSLEKHVKGQDRTPGSNLIQQKAHAMANVIIDNGLKDVSEVWGSEVSLYYPELYAGTTDLVGIYKGKPFIGDFKQSRRLKKKEWVEDYYLQLTAYAEAHNKQYGTKIQNGRMFICTQNNEFQSFEIENYDKWVGKWYAKLEQYYKSVL